MKKIILYILCIGIFMSAPKAFAATKVMSDNYIFQGTTNWFQKGVTIGSQGSGGVTYFNGSIVNSTTDSNGNDNPVAFGDNVRIDGSIFRGSKSGWQSNSFSVKVDDSMRVYGELVVDQASTFSQTLTVAGVTTLQGALAASGGMSASKAIAASGGNVASFTQSSQDDATAARSALYLSTNGTSAANDYLVYSTPFKVSKDGALTTTGAITAGGLTLGDAASVSGLESRGTLSFYLGTMTPSTPLSNVFTKWLPGSTLTPVRVSVLSTAALSGGTATITLSDDEGVTSDTLTISDGQKIGYLTSFTNFNTIDTTKGLTVSMSNGNTFAGELTLIIEYTASVQ